MFLKISAPKGLASLKAWLKLRSKLVLCLEELFFAPYWQIFIQEAFWPVKSISRTVSSSMVLSVCLTPHLSPTLMGYRKIPITQPKNAETVMTNYYSNSKLGNLYIFVTILLLLIPINWNAALLGCRPTKKKYRIWKEPGRNGKG